jgi:hypothetical protein
VSQENPFTLAMNKKAAFLVNGVSLTDEPHKIKVGFVAAGIGKLGFEFIDIPALD